jgi:hypothetical protein
MKNAIDTTHHLNFLSSPWNDPLGVGGYMAFKIGTCNGLYTIKPQMLMLISVNNEERGNGHLNDVFEWFEYGAKFQSVPLSIVAFLNDRFYHHCLEKRGFHPWTWENQKAVIKYFDRPLANSPGNG